jgi:hypothetical protein
MKYRIKNKTERELINALFGITELNATKNQDTSLCIQASFGVDTYGIWYFKTEPVKELEDEWHPYPLIKPQAEGKYLCVWKYNPDNSIEQTVIAFRNKKFVDWDSDILGWRELPKVWKE